jgi:hypothetical protein
LERNLGARGSARTIRFVALRVVRVSVRGWSVFAHTVVVLASKTSFGFSGLLALSVLSAFTVRSP